MNDNNTPRDFFLHAGAFITLYIGAIALLTLIFTVINYQFRDILAGVVYYDPYGGPIRFAIASLVVLSPVCVYFFYLIQGEARRQEIRRSLGIRKWLTYITLFISGATVIGALIVLLNNFLEGSLPTPFLLKLVTLLAVMGAGFGYFFADIRGYWVAHAEYSRYVGIALILVVLFSIVGGMTIIGSPMTQRQLRIDNQQVSDLENISQQVLGYWQQTEGLPKDLSLLNNNFSGYRIPQAPEGQPAYEYTVTGPLSFKLCATFLQDSPSTDLSSAYLVGFTEPVQWNHTAGETCFDRTIDPELFKQEPTINVQKPIEMPVTR